MARRPSRKQARRDALVVLYQYEVRGDRPERLYDELKEREGYRADDYTVAQVAGVLAETQALDAVIARYSRDWPVERLAPLERSVLRLAIHEIEAGTTPPEVAVDEAVRLARRYSTDRAGSLVNGILGAFLRDREDGDGAGSTEGVSAASDSVEGVPAEGAGDVESGADGEDAGDG